MVCRSGRLSASTGDTTAAGVEWCAVEAAVATSSSCPRSVTSRRGSATTAFTTPSPPPSHPQCRISLQPLSPSPSSSSPSPSSTSSPLSYPPAPAVSRPPPPAVPYTSRADPPPKPSQPAPAPAPIPSSRPPIPAPAPRSKKPETTSPPPPEEPAEEVIQPRLPARNPPPPTPTRSAPVPTPAPAPTPAVPVRGPPPAAPQEQPHHSHPCHQPQRLPVLLRLRPVRPRQSWITSPVPMMTTPWHSRRGMLWWSSSEVRRGCGGEGAWLMGRRVCSLFGMSMTPATTTTMMTMMIELKCCFFSTTFLCKTTRIYS